MIDPTLLSEIDGLLDLKENWDSYGAPPPNPKAAIRLALLLNRILRPDTPLPFIVPKFDGGMEAEWVEEGSGIMVNVSVGDDGFTYGAYVYGLKEEIPEWEGEFDDEDALVEGTPLCKALRLLRSR